MDSLKNGTILHGKSYDYKIVKTLGQGSFGITYLATVNIVGALGSIPSSTKVAVKEFFMRDVNGRSEETVTTGSRDGIFHKYKRRFIKEARTLSRMNHPNIVHVLDLFEENNTAYYVMEYLPGGSLDKLISDRGGLPFAESSLLIKQIASALEYMHSHRILHLDLKPANVMLSKSGRAVLIDFSLTKEFDADGNPESSTTVGHGTPGYAPLEQSNYQSGQGFHVTMDIYALGATLYKMLTGKRPPEASYILNEGVGMLTVEGARGEVATDAIRKAMDPLKGRRYQTVGAFMSALGLSPQIVDSQENPERPFPENTISFLMIMEDRSIVYYYRGTVYKSHDRGFLDEVGEISSISNLRALFNRLFVKSEILSFSDFFSRYKETISNADYVYVSFLRENDYFRIMSAYAKSDSYVRMTRSMRENSFIAVFLSNQLSNKGAESSYQVNSIHYDNWEVGFDCGDGVCEMMVDFRERVKESYHIEGHKYTIKSSKNLKIALLGGILIEHFVLTGKKKDFLLMDVIPFSICFGPQWGNMIPTMIECGEIMPMRHTETFDFVGTDIMAIKIANRIHRINVIEDFGYAPREIECTAEVGVHLRDIRFEIKDKSSGKSKTYKIEDLTDLYDMDWVESEQTEKLWN